MSKKHTITVYKHLPETIRFIQILINESTAILIRHGETSQTAKQLSAGFVADVCRQLSGKSQYFGNNISLDAESRHINIRAGHKNGKSIKQLATQYRLSERRIYDVLYYEKDKPAAKAATSSAPLLAVSATRMFLKVGIPQDDAIEAARGLLAVLSAKFGGAAFYVPSERRAAFILRDIDIFRMHKSGKSKIWLSEHFGLFVEDVVKVIENYPAPAMPGWELPIIKKRLAACTTGFREYVEVNLTNNVEDLPEVVSSLEAAAELINRAEEIIKKIDGGYYGSDV